MSRTGEYFLEVEQYMRDEQNIIEFEMHMLESAFRNLENIITNILSKDGYDKAEIRCQYKQIDGFAIQLRYDYWQPIKQSTLNKIKQLTGITPKLFEIEDEDCGPLVAYDLNFEIN
jgi:hypothetical protein